MFIHLISSILVSTVLSAGQEQRLQQQFVTCQLGEIQVNGKCLSFAAPGTPCTDSRQCLDKSTCINQRCTCATPNAEIINNYCIVPSSTSCSRTQTMVNGQCVTYSTVGKQCFGDSQCVGGAYCVNTMQFGNGQPETGNTCTCPPTLNPMYGYCVANPTQTTQCSIQQVLVNGACYGLVQTGKPCEVSQQCLGGGQCSYYTSWEKRCSSENKFCPPGQVYVNDQCVTATQPGSFCQTSQQCANNGRCLNGVCQTGNNGQCKAYQVSVSGQCLDTVSIGQQCTAQQQCINNANCVSNRCQCNAGLTFNGQACLSAGIFPTCSGLTVSSNGQCLQLVSMRQSCSATPQCMGFSVCLSSVCACPYAYTEVDGVCRRSSSLNNNCPSGQVMSPSGACLNMVGIGGSCQISQQCPSGGSCAQGICTTGSSPGGLTCSDPNKEVVMENGQPMRCLSGQCAGNSQCDYSSDRYICCRPRSSAEPPSGICPSGQSAEVLSDGNIKNCLQQSCSSGRICQYSPVINGYACCGTTFG